MFTILLSHTALFREFYFASSGIRMDQVMQLVDPAKQFAKDSLRLVKRCTKPDRKGYYEINFDNFLPVCVIRIKIY